MTMGLSQGYPPQPLGLVFAFGSQPNLASDQTSNDPATDPSVWILLHVLHRAKNDAEL
jgi:hypothetical protein